MKKTPNLKLVKTVLPDNSREVHARLMLGSSAPEYLLPSQHQDHANFALMQYEFHSTMAKMKNASSKSVAILLSEKVDFLHKQIVSVIKRNTETGLFSVELRQAIYELASANGHYLGSWQILGKATMANCCEGCGLAVTIHQTLGVSGEMLILRCQDIKHSITE